MTEQEKEIETIKERTLSLKLSDADVNRIALKAGAFGLSVPELLENFIGDLIDGTYSNGSDERMYANQWFDRCGFSMLSENTFLKFLIEVQGVDSAVGYWHKLQELDKVIFEFKSANPWASDDSRIIISLREKKNFQIEGLEELFNEYKEGLGSPVGTLEEQMAKVIKWHQNLSALKNSQSTIE